MNNCYHLVIYRYGGWCSFPLSRLLFLILILLPFNTKGQNDIWILDGFGLDFKTEPPSIISPLNDYYYISNINSITDTRGELIFYSDGLSVFNREHQKMPNGEYIRGGLGASGSAYIVPVPDSPNFYYLFSIEDVFVNREGVLYYSIVDMTRENGLGDVLVGKKNIPLLSGVTEFLVGAKGTLGTSWIITHARDTNLFYSLPISVEGLGEPVVSENEPTFIRHPRSVNPTYIGSGIAFSHDFRKLALSYNASPEYKENEKSNFSMFLYDFDQCTGQISNALQLERDSTLRATNPCFSSDNTKLYVNEVRSERTGDEIEYENKLYQFDLSQNDINAINSSKSLIAQPEGRISGSNMQLGPNNQIYVGRRDRAFIDLIKAPNNKGVACDYVINGLDLQGIMNDNTIFQKLILPYDSLASKVPIIPPDTTLCLGDHITIDLSAYSGHDWSDGSREAIRSINSPGTYMVSIETDQGCLIQDSIKISYIDEGDILSDTSLCPRSELLLDLRAYEDVIWSDGSDESLRLLTDEGSYRVSLMTAQGCLIEDSISVRYIDTEALDLGADESLCADEAIQLIAPVGSESYIWSTGEQTSSITVTEPGYYYLTVVQDGCMITDSILISRSEDCYTDCNIYIPNAIKLNSSLGNERLSPVSNCTLSDYQMDIYDRWGGLLYRSLSPDYAWDGTTSGQQVNSGVYLYRLSYRYPDAPKSEYRTGSIMVYR